MPYASFDDWFRLLTNHSAPRPWQATLASNPDCRNRLVRIATGQGKTEGVLAAWSFYRVNYGDARWPRRLVWCLPMRVLVEQTVAVAQELAARMPAQRRPQVYAAMGGEDGGEWFLAPERPAIIIGTQDMLLSRTMNRGYASPRARWPMEFGLLNQDALWVMDEVQLMDVCLATSAQMQAFRDEDESKGLRPCRTWWMSATLQPGWLRTVDTAPYHDSWIRDPCEVPADQRRGGLWNITKSVSVEEIEPKDAKTFAKRILEAHNELADGEYGRITLVVCNTVERACETFDALRDAGRTDGIELVHSRFRPHERDKWRKTFVNRRACTSGKDLIIVATQVVEAGVDISAGLLITELAPWPSLVQRFGRCARYGGVGRVLVVNRGCDEKQAAPYDPASLESAWETVQQLRDVGIASLESHEESLAPEAKRRLYPYAPAHLLLRKEFDEFFDTTPDLTGADVDVSRFIRSGEERDLQVFWVDLDKKEHPEAARRPQRSELCAVPFLKARDWLCGEETKSARKPKLRGGVRAWVWDWLDGNWVPAARDSLLPGRTVCVASVCGGYRLDRGFDPHSRVAVSAVPLEQIPEEVQAFDDADDEQNGEQLSASRGWKTIAVHSAEVAQAVHAIAGEVGLSAELQNLLELAAVWHDWGKAHLAFQGSIRGVEKTPRLDRGDVAKAPDECWPARWRYHYLDGSECRPAFRHELASALGLFALLETYAPDHPALLGPWKDVLAALGHEPPSGRQAESSNPLVARLTNCTAEDFDLVAYLIASL